VEQEMTKHIVQLPNPDGSLLLRELNHRIKNELTSAIYAVSAKAVRSDSAAVKAALLDVVDLLHQSADVHRALHMPDQGRLADAARYLQQLCFSITKYRLDRLAIRVLFSADDLRLEGERCWKLGLIVSELLTNVARHAQFDGEHPELRVELMLAGNVVKCGISDNGSAPEPIRRGRGAYDYRRAGQQFRRPRSYVLRRRRIFLPSHLSIDRGRATRRRRDSCCFEAEEDAPPSTVAGV
jgi:two-component sensor histidine kinase